MNKKIVSKDGSYIYLQKDGQVWCSQDERTFTSPAYVCNHVANIYALLGVDRKYDKYYAVEYKLLKHAERFKINRLRALKQTVEDTEVGKLVVIKYGYVSNTEFDSLLRKRKVVPCFNRKAVLLKYKDFKWKDK